MPPEQGDTSGLSPGQVTPPGAPGAGPAPATSSGSLSPPCHPNPAPPSHSHVPRKDSGWHLGTARAARPVRLNWADWEATGGARGPPAGQRGQCHPRWRPCDRGDTARGWHCPLCRESAGPGALVAPAGDPVAPGGDLGTMSQAVTPGCAGSRWHWHDTERPGCPKMGTEQLRGGDRIGDKTA